MKILNNKGVKIPQPVKRKLELEMGSILSCMRMLACSNAQGIATYRHAGISWPPFLWPAPSRQCDEQHPACLPSQLLLLP